MSATCSLCDNDSGEIIQYPNDDYYHSDCISRWLIENEEDFDIEEFLNETNTLTEKDKLRIKKEFIRREDNYVFDNLLHMVMTSDSDISNEIFDYMIINNMIIKNNPTSRYTGGHEKKPQEKVISCKIREQCKSHTSSFRTGRCGGDICDDCGYYSGMCMTNFCHCCCFISN